MARGRVIALLGAESTGKTALAQALAQRLSAHLAASGAGNTIWVPEWLRLWCEAAGRTPLPQEQVEIAREQSRLIEAACHTHDWVVADTTAMMTAIYSQWLFKDASLMPEALALQRGYALTLVTDNDLPWVADGQMRDGPHVRQPVLQSIREALDGAAIPWTLVRGAGQTRLDSAWRSVEDLMAGY